MHVLPDVMQIWSVKSTSFYCEAKRCLISTGKFQPCCLVCVSYLERKALSWKFVETPAWRSKAEFCSLCSPILFSGLLCPRLPFLWIWLPSGQAFYSPLPHGTASVSVSAPTLQQTSSLSKWAPVCCSPVPPDCV